MRALIVEDEPDLARILHDGLTEEGYAVDLSMDGEDGLWRTTTIDYDVVVLDLGLPILDGLEILRRMRSGGRDTPVLILTARDGVRERVLGLDLGADDYLVKPFAWEELLARIRALLRRGPHGTDGTLRHCDVILDPAKRTVSRGGEPVRLTAKEFQVLHLLMTDPERVFTRTEIVEHVYNDDFDGMSNTIDVFLSRLRRKLNRPGRASVLRTVRGVGYAFGAEHAA